jgi:hypothetical protein
VRTAARRYLVASSFLAGFGAAAIAGAVVPPHAWPAVAGWASTSVANLEHHPVGSLMVSAFVAEGSQYAWPLLIALAMFGANRALGNLRTIAVCAAAQVIGTLVSEGIVAYRVDQADLPVSYRHLLDIGPSYVVVAAIAAAVIAGSRPARAAALVDFALLVFPGRIFSGLGDLDVAAVGHLTALVVGAGAALILARGGEEPRRALRPRRAGRGRAAVSGGDRAAVSGGDRPDQGAYPVGDPGGQPSQQ